MATSCSVLSRTQPPEVRRSLYLLQEDQGFQVMVEAMRERIQSLTDLLPREQSLDKIRQTQGEITALKWVLGLPTDLGRDPRKEAERYLG